MFFASCFVNLAGWRRIKPMPLHPCWPLCCSFSVEWMYCMYVRLQCIILMVCFCLLFGTVPTGSFDRKMFLFFVCLYNHGLKNLREFHSQFPVKESIFLEHCTMELHTFLGFTQLQPAAALLEKDCNQLVHYLRKTANSYCTVREKLQQANALLEKNCNQLLHC